MLREFLSVSVLVVCFAGNAVAASEEASASTAQKQQEIDTNLPSEQSVKKETTSPRAQLKGDAPEQRKSLGRHGNAQMTRERVLRE